MRGRGGRGITHVAVDVGLPLEARLVGGQLDPHVQLGERDLHARGGVLLHDGDLVVEARRAAGDEVALHADAVDGDALVLEHLDDPHGAVGLGAGRLEVVVVVVQLRVRVDLVRRPEGELDEVLAQRVVEDRLAVRAVLVQGLVDHVPRVALALVVAGHLGDVVDDDLAQLLGRPLRLLDPRRQLAVPDERVAAEELAVLLGEARDDVALGEVELAMRRLGEEPLVCRALEDDRSRRVREADAGEGEGSVDIPCGRWWAWSGRTRQRR